MLSILSRDTEDCQAIPPQGNIKYQAGYTSLSNHVKQIIYSSTKIVKLLL